MIKLGLYKKMEKKLICNKCSASSNKSCFAVICSSMGYSLTQVLIDE